jgi:hypothetical protein
VTAPKLRHFLGYQRGLDVEARSRERVEHRARLRALAADIADTRGALRGARSAFSHFLLVSLRAERVVERAHAVDLACGWALEAVRLDRVLKEKIEERRAVCRTTRGSE